jgi:hypothetical protein
MKRGIVRYKAESRVLGNMKTTTALYQPLQ